MDTLIFGSLPPWASFVAEKGLTVKASSNPIQDLLDALSEDYQLVTRYGVGTEGLPDPKTMCKGPCEGMGVVPYDFSEPAPGQAYIVYSDEEERVYRPLWEEAEAKEPAEDGWHFLVCQDCLGSGKRMDIAAHVRKRGNKWVVTNKAGDKTLGTHTTKEEADAQLRAIESHVHGSQTFRFITDISEADPNEYTLRVSLADDAQIAAVPEGFRPMLDEIADSLGMVSSSDFQWQWSSEDTMSEQKAKELRDKFVAEVKAKAKANAAYGKYLDVAAGVNEPRFWIEPSGKLYLLSPNELHSDWIKENYEEGVTQEQAISFGWTRVVCNLSDKVLYISAATEDKILPAILKVSKKDPRCALVKEVVGSWSGENEWAEVPVLKGEDAEQAWKRRKDARHRVDAKISDEMLLAYADDILTEEQVKAFDTFLATNIHLEKNDVGPKERKLVLDFIGHPAVHEKEGLGKLQNLLRWAIDQKIQQAKRLTSSLIFSDMSPAEEAIGQALGEASMAWYPRPEDQVFKADEAKAIMKKLVEKLKKYGLKAGLSPVLFHATSLPQAASIVKDDAFKLTAATGADLNTLGVTVPGGKLFYLSTARSATGAYGNDPYRSGVMFVLDGTALAHKYSGESVDYWGPEFRNVKPRGFEMEDRVFSKEPSIQDLNKYVTAILCYYDPEKAEDMDKRAVRELALSAKTRGIPFRMYTDKNAYITDNEAKSVPVTSVPLNTPPKESHKSFGPFPARELEALTELYRAPVGSDLSEQALKVKNSLIYEAYRRDNEISRAEADLHNNKSNGKANSFVKCMQDAGVRDVKGLVDVLVNKWGKKEDVEASIQARSEDLEIDTLNEIPGKAVTFKNGPFAFVVNKNILTIWLNNAKIDEKKFKDFQEAADKAWAMAEKQAKARASVAASLIDYPMPALSPDLFDGESLKPAVRDFLVASVFQILKSEFISPESWTEQLLLGSSIATQFYNKDTDIDVKAVYNKDKFLEYNPMLEIYGEDLEEFLDDALGGHDRTITFGTHPIEIRMRPEAYFESGEGVEATDALLDIQSGQWIKKAPKVDPETFDRQELVGPGEKEAKRIAQDWDTALGSIRRDLSDLKMINDYYSVVPSEEQDPKVFTYAGELGNSIVRKVQVLAEDRKAVKLARGRAYHTGGTTKGFVNANEKVIVFKTLQSYGYMNVIYNLSHWVDTILENASTVRPSDAERGLTILTNGFSWEASQLIFSGEVPGQDGSRWPDDDAWEDAKDGDSQGQGTHPRDTNETPRNRPRMSRTDKDKRTMIREDDPTGMPEPPELDSVGDANLVYPMAGSIDNSCKMTITADDVFDKVQKAAAASIEGDPAFVDYHSNPELAEKLGKIQKGIHEAKTVMDIKNVWDEYSPTEPWTNVVGDAGIS